MTDRNRNGYRDWEVDTDDTDNTARDCDNRKSKQDKTYGNDGGGKGGNRQSGWFFGNHPE